jgi:hypothetical protein
MPPDDLDELIGTHGLTNRAFIAIEDAGLMTEDAHPIGYRAPRWAVEIAKAVTAVLGSSRFAGSILAFAKNNPGHRAAMVAIARALPHARGEADHALHEYANSVDPEYDRDF